MQNSSEFQSFDLHFIEHTSGGPLAASGADPAVHGGRYRQACEGGGPPERDLPGLGD